MYCQTDVDLYSKINLDLALDLQIWIDSNLDCGLVSIIQSTGIEIDLSRARARSRFRY